MDTSGHMTNKNRYISISTSPVATKLHKRMVYDKSYKPKSHISFLVQVVM